MPPPPTAIGWGTYRAGSLINCGPRHPPERKPLVAVVPLEWPFRCLEPNWPWLCSSLVWPYSLFEEASLRERLLVAVAERAEGCFRGFQGWWQGGSHSLGFVLAGW